MLDASGDLDVRVDPSHLHQLLWNLCENALKYGRRDDDDAPIELRTGRIATSERPLLEVLDRGPGIAAARRRAHLRAVLHRPARAAPAWACSSPGSWRSAIAPC